VEQLQGHDGPVWEVAWAHPKFGMILASCSYDGKVCVWKETQVGQRWERVFEMSLSQQQVKPLPLSSRALSALFFPLYPLARSPLPHHSVYVLSAPLSHTTPTFLAGVCERH
jgi:WD40 repeat protein